MIRALSTLEKGIDLPMVKVSMKYLKITIFSVIKFTSAITLDYDTPSELLSTQNSPNRSPEWNSAGVGESWLGSQNQFVPVIDTRACMSAQLSQTICVLTMINRYSRYAWEMCCLITFTWKRRQNIST